MLGNLIGTYDLHVRSLTRYEAALSPSLGGSALAKPDAPWQADVRN
jgi:hypothetical protein